MRAFKIVFLASTVITLTDLAFVSRAGADGYEHRRLPRIHHEVVYGQPEFGYPRFPIPFFWWWCGFDNNHHDTWCGGHDHHQQMMKEKHHEKHHHHRYVKEQHHEHDHDHYGKGHDHDHYGEGHDHDHYGKDHHEHYVKDHHEHYVKDHHEHGWKSGTGKSGHGWMSGKGDGKWDKGGWSSGKGGNQWDNHWGHNGHKPPHGGKNQQTAGGHHHNGNAAAAYVGAAVGCSAAWLIGEGAYTAATEHRELTYSEAYSTVGGCFLPIIGSYLGYEFGKQADICLANKTCPGMANNSYR